VSKYNTIHRGLFTVCLLFLLTQVAHGQSVLHFARAVYGNAQDTRLAITNPNSYHADVQLTFYGADGNPIANGMMNPVSYRIGPRSEFSMLASELFVAGSGDGWIQATSSSSGLSGFYLSGDFVKTMEGTETGTPQLIQSIPFLWDVQSSRSDIVIINPGTSRANVTVNLYNLRGDEQPSIVRDIPAHGVFRFRPSFSFLVPGAAGASARVTSSVPVIAMGVADTQDALMFINGQPDQPLTSRIAPHFVAGNGVDSELVLSNPGTSSVAVTIGLYGTGATGSTQMASMTATIPARSVASYDSRSLLGQLPVPVVDGWLRVDSPNVTINGAVVIKSGAYMTTIPLQRTSAERMTFSQLTDTSDTYTTLSLVNPSAVEAVVEMTFLRLDGTVIGQRTLAIPSSGQLVAQPHDLVPETAGVESGFISVRSSVGIYGVEIVGSSNFSFATAVVPQRLNLGFNPNPPAQLPRIVRIEGPAASEVTVGTTLRVTVSDVSTDTQVLLGNQTIQPRFLAPGIGVLLVDIPPIEPGYANLRIRVRGLESQPTRLRIVALEDTQPLVEAQGRAFYQKIEITDGGLDLGRRSMVPVRNARVEVLDAATQGVVSVSETDSIGRFAVLVPQTPVIVRVVSRLRSSDLRVADNMNNFVLYSMSTSFDRRENDRMLIADTGRVSGAFNILEMIQRSNDLVRLGDPRVIPPAPTISWSVLNTKANTGTSGFNVTTNSAKILGDRSPTPNADSDEFDDSVIVHEYAHLLAARFSRDDSPGGHHELGDNLDPRVAWSEAWANFFSSAVRNDSVWRDSMGANGSLLYRFDVEENQPSGDKGGYGSEYSIHSLLWDMFDTQNDAADNAQYPFSAIWDAFVDLKGDHFVYLPDFLEHFVSRNPSEAEALRTMVVARSIDFQPNVRPSVTNPWPKNIVPGEAAQGTVNSLTRQRWNLAESSHFYTFTTQGQMLAIRLDILGLGPGNNGSANDLDVFLTDENGRLIEGSDRGLNGQSELITRRLAAGTYMVEVRSYYTRAETNGRVFNSGDYRLSVMAQ